MVEVVVQKYSKKKPLFGRGNNYQLMAKFSLGDNWAHGFRPAAAEQHDVLRSPKS